VCVDKARRVVEPISVDEQIAIDTAILRIRYKLGLADCFAAELAIRLGATLVTADPEFAKLGKQLKVLALPRHTG
jgi:predicted nucleic acid-binding protein